MNVSGNKLISDDLMSKKVVTDPHSYYKTLREIEPVHWNDRWGGWILTSYDDCIQVLRDSIHFSSDRMGFLAKELSNKEKEAISPIFEILSRWMVFMDPPKHTQLRMLLNPLFTPKGVEKYRVMVKGIVEKALDNITEQGDIDFVHDYAYKVPMAAILQLLGTPDMDTESIKEWSEKIGLFFFIKADESNRREIACEGIDSLVEYLKPIIADRRLTPGDDLISILIEAQKAGKLDEEDVLATCVLLVFGGHETTMNLIANGTLALINHPHEWSRLKKDPNLIEFAVEELLRFDGSVKATVRWAKEDVQVGDKKLKKGDRVLVCLSAANRDPQHFKNPHDLNISRDPNPHAAFAHGIHVCLGAPLARIEAQEAILGLIRRLEIPTLHNKELKYHPSLVHRALTELPMSVNSIQEHIAV